MRKTLFLAAISIVGLTLTGCGSSTSPSASSDNNSWVQQVDAGASLSCAHFRNVVKDGAAGILSDAEYRTKVKEVYNSARVSTETGIADNAQAMLAALTSGDTTAFSDAATAFVNACVALGQ